MTKLTILLLTIVAWELNPLIVLAFIVIYKM